jgi:TolB protein
VAFTSFVKGTSDVTMFSLELNRIVAFPRFGGTNVSPAWSPDGKQLAFSSSMRGDPEIFISDANGVNPKRVTAFTGSDVSPVWNPKTGSQIAFVSGRTGLPQIYMMEADGTNLQRLTDTGYAVSPSWSPNGQFLTFAWRRNYGPGAPGGQDIYVMDIANKKWVQLTHGSGVNDYPSWAPDGRHIVFESTRGGSTQIWSMLADGSQQRQLTTSGKNQQPNWSFR